MSLFDEEDEGIGTEENEEKKKNKKPIKKSRSPERGIDDDTNFAFKPEKSIWESPFLAADRGLDSGYPSSHSSEQSKGADEQDDMLQKFGIAITFKSDSEPGSPSVIVNEETRLLKTADRRETKSVSPQSTPPVIPARRKKLGEAPPPPEKSWKKDKKAEVDPVPAVPSWRSHQPEEATPSRSSPQHRAAPSMSSHECKEAPPARPCRKKCEHREAVPSRRSHEREEVVPAWKKHEESGHVSPVFVEDPGESSTDHMPGVHTSSRFDFSAEVTSSIRQEVAAVAPMVGGQDNLALDNPTGYDPDPFLDDWTPDILSKSTVRIFLVSLIYKQ